MATGERGGGDVGTTRTLLGGGDHRAARGPLLVLAATVVATLVVTLVGAFLGAFPGAFDPSTVAAQDRSFSIDALDTDAELRADGSMLVTERVTYTYDGGPFNFGIRSFERNRADISQFAAADGDGPLEVIAPEDSVSGEWEWALRRPTSDTTETYTLTYFVSPQVQVGRDVSVIDWQFVGTEHPGIGQVSIRLRFPLAVVPAIPETPDDDVNVLRAWAHGPSNGTVRLAPSEVVARVRDVPAGEFVEIVALAPASTFNTKGTEDLLPGVLAAERRYQDDVEQRAADRRSGWLISAMVAAMGAVGAGALWLVGGREGRSTEVQGEYWREPLDDPPAVALTNLRRGSVDAGPTIAGTLVDLAQRGYLRITGEREERFGPDKVVHRYTWLGKPFGADVLAYEKDLLELVFRGTTETTSEELQDWAKANQTTAKKKLDEVTGGVKAEFRRRGYGEQSNGRLVASLVVVCAVVGVVTVVATLVTGYGFGWWGVAIAAALFGIGTKLLSNRNQASVEAAAKAEGLKKFLKDFSQLEDAPVGHLILWERYLVYAVALGVSAELVRGLAARLPSLLADPAFGAWYTPAPGMHGRFDGFDRIESSGSSFVSASTPSSSGSGGGFSGGGGGGGGGGGFGAR